MCRWIAYTGPDLVLAEVLVRPTQSLLAQSRHALEATFEVNADGFGVGWYRAGVDAPGVYHETRPAWNDENLVSLASHVSSSLFMAHIRAATSTVSRTNCHPFRRGKWLFQHNGIIGGFSHMRHQLAAATDPEVFAQQQGCTDSEAMFGLCLSEGLEDDPAGAIARMIAQVESARSQHRIDDPFRMTIATSDGQTLWAARWQSDGGDGPSLYHSASQAALDHASARAGVIESSATMVVSEPLDGCDQHWVEVPPQSILRAEASTVEVSPIAL